MPDSLKDEVWGARALAVATDVAEMLRGCCGTGGGVSEVVQDLAANLLDSESPSFIRVTRHPAPGATYHVTATFLEDKFREDLAAAAHERLGCVWHVR